MVVVLDFENSANWTIKDSQFLITSPEVLLPEYLSVDITSNIIGVFVANSEALISWNFAGLACQQIELPFGPNSSSAINYRKLWLKQKQLLIFSRLTSTYKLKIRFPTWFDRASVTIWEYTGPQFEAIETQLQQVHRKLDNLLERPL